jgi:carbon monoxide dehydrogenase subunit G
VRIARQFDVDRPRDAVVEIVAREEMLLGLFPDAKTEIVSRDGDRVTARMRYRALGRDGEATFHFTFLLDGGVRFEKVCDGNVWRELRGEMFFEESGARTRVRIEMDGRTRPLVPEFTIKGAMKEQIDQMATALRERIESA